MTLIDRVHDELANGRPLLLDCATGTELEQRGADMHGNAWCAMATLTHPDILRSIHEDYIRAGARVITTNTFSTNRNMLEPAGLGDRFEEMNRSAVAIARQARDATGSGDSVLIAGSMSHQIPVLRDRDQRDQRAVPAPETARVNFRDMAAVLADSGVDLLLMEMMSDPELAVPALEAARETGLPIWVGLSVRAGDNGEPVSYSRPEISMQEMLAAIPLHGVSVAGIMHSTVSITDAALAQLGAHFDGALMAYPDSGYFRMPNWQFVDIISPEDLVTEVRQWMVRRRVQVIGGCCGLGLSHLQALAPLVREAR